MLLIFPPYLNNSYIEPIAFIDEIWRPINTNIHPELKENIYFVSSFGRVFSNGYKSLHNQESKFLNLELSNTGYLRVHLVANDNNAKHYNVHRLVLESFAPVENMEKLFVNHIDGNKTNNNISNLEWTTPEQNAQHAILNNFVKWKSGDNCSWSTIDQNKADQIAQLLSSCCFTNVEIANIVGCNVSIVRNILHGISWRDSYEKYQLWKFKLGKPKNNFTKEDVNKLKNYILKNIHKYDPSYYRALCMDACKDLFNLKINRSIYIEVMDIIYEILNT